MSPGTNAQGHRLWLDHNPHHTYWSLLYCARSLSPLSAWHLHPWKHCVFQHLHCSHLCALLHADLRASSAFTPSFQLSQTLYILPSLTCVSPPPGSLFPIKCLSSAHCQCSKCMLPLAPSFRVCLVRCKLLQHANEVSLTFISRAASDPSHWLPRGTVFSM